MGQSHLGLFPCGTLEDQKDDLEETKRPGDLSSEEYVEQVVTINKHLTYYKHNAGTCSICQINQKIISKNFVGAFQSKYALGYSSVMGAPLALD